MIVVAAPTLELAPRVLLVTHPAGAVGGIATFTDRLVHHLRSRADIITLPYRRIYPSRTAPGREERRRVTAPPRGDPIVYLPWTWPRSMVRVVRLRPALVVVQWWHPILAPYLLALVKVAHMCGARFALVCHNAEPHERFPASRALTRVTLRAADIVWTLSEHVATDARRIAPHTAVVALNHPPNLSAAGAAPGPRATASAAVAPRENAPALLFFGYVRPYKGLDDLLEALALMTSTPPATLTVAGPFYQPVEQVRRHVDELRLTERVRLLDGYVPEEDVADLFAAADLVVLPYRSASQSGVLSLAAEFGRPVVATDVGSLAADLRGRGLIAPPQDPVALADVLDKAVTRMPVPPPVPGGWTPWADAVIFAAKPEEVSR